MTRLLLFLIFALPAFGQWANGYTYKATFTVNAAQITGTLSGFTVVITSGANSEMKTSANGGHVLHTCSQTLYSLTVPADFLLTSDSAGTTPLPGWQFDTYNASTGAFSLHAQVSSIAAGTTVYGWYGKSSQTTCLGGSASSTWDANTLSAIAAPDGTTLNSSDYLGNTVTAGTSAPTAGSGPSANAAGSIVTSGNANSSLSIAGMGRRTIPYTICAWVNLTAHTSGTKDFAMGDSSNATGSQPTSFGLARYSSTGKMSVYTMDGASPSVHFYEAIGTTTVSTGAWHYVCGVASTSNMSLFLDGTQEGNQPSLSGVTLTVLSQTAMKVGDDGVVSLPWNGKISEITIDGTNRSAAWISPRHANTSDPSTFWASTYGLTADTASFVISPSVIPSGHAGDITLTLSGTATSWVDGSTVMTASGVDDVTCGDVTVTSSTTATVACTTGAGTGMLTLTETVTGTASAATTVATPTFVISPGRGNTSSIQTLTLSSTNTVWSQETAAGLFSVSGGTGASIGTPTITTDTAGTVALTVGSASGTLTITDTSTGLTASFVAGGTGGTCAVVGVQ